MTRPFKSKDRLSKLLTRFEAWLHHREQARPIVGAYPQPSIRLPVAAVPQIMPSASLHQERLVSRRRPLAARSVVSAEEYGSANIVAKMRPARTENYAYPSPVTYKQSWTYPSSVDPIPVWYRVAGYEDKAHKPK